jgi:hypothetical protein
VDLERSAHPDVEVQDRPLEHVHPFREDDRPVRGDVLHLHFERVHEALEALEGLDDRRLAACRGERDVLVDGVVGEQGEGALGVLLLERGQKLFDDGDLG